jgi:hypothetical protein
LISTYPLSPPRPMDTSQSLMPALVTFAKSEEQVSLGCLLQAFGLFKPDRRAEMPSFRLALPYHCDLLANGKLYDNDKPESFLDLFAENDRSGGRKTSDLTTSSALEARPLPFVPVVGQS